jgi:hypothetical protein
MRIGVCVFVLGVVLVGCGGGASGDSGESAGADIKQVDCADAIDVTFGAPKLDSDAQITHEADQDGVEFKALAGALTTAKGLKGIDAHGTFTNAAAGACNYKLTAKSGGAAIDGNLHTIGSSGRFFLRYEVGDVLYNMTVKAISKTSITLDGSTATLMLNDGGTEFHGEPDPSVKSGTVDVKASIPQ